MVLDESKIGLHKPQQQSLGLLITIGDTKFEWLEMAECVFIEVYLLHPNLSLFTIDQTHTSIQE